MSGDNQNITSNGTATSEVKMMEPVFGAEMAFAMVTVATIGAFANGFSACYIGRTFPTRKVAIFFLALADSVVSFVGGVLFLVTFLVSLYHRDIYVCILNNFSRMFQVYSGMLISFEIAAIR